MAVARIQDEVLQCTICYDTFQTPKTLPCLHTFCEHCLRDYITGIQGVAKKMGFSCPICREFIKAPEPKKKPILWAPLFKTNFHLNKLMKALENDESTADEDIKEKCKDHPQKELDLYCVSCEKMICHLCAGISHRGCSLVVTIEEAASDRRVHLQRTGGEMDAILEKSRDQVSSAKHHLERLESLRSDCEVRIRKYADVLVKHIREKEAELVEELEDAHGGLKEKVDLRIDNFREQQKKYHQMCIEIKNVVSHGSLGQVLRAASKVADAPILNSNTMSSICDQLEKVELTFVPGASLKNLFLTDFELGTIHVGRQETRETSPPKVQTSEEKITFKDDQSIALRNQPTGPRHDSRKRTKTLVEAPSAEANKQSHPRSKRPVKIMTIPCKHRADDQPPKLRDIVVLPREDGGSRNDVILVTDWNNQCVKAYRSRRDRDSRLPLGGKPWCITALSESSVAVSLPLSQQICVLKVGLSLMLLSSVVAEKRYSGLAALDVNTLVASGGSEPPSVDIIHVSGQVLHSFSQDASSNPLFAYPAYVTTTPGGHIVVSDRDAGKVTCMTRDGSMLWCFNPKGHQKLVNPVGVYCDAKGDVCLVEKRGLLRLTADGHYIGAVLRESDGVLNPKGVWSRDDGTVYITQKDGEICVYNVRN